MRYRAAVVISAALVMAASLAAQQKPQDVALQAAIRTETAAGDLKGAIAQYEQVAAKYKTDRAVVATALVRMAECYRMLGEAQAKPIFERVVREFADQTEAVTLARGRLAQGKSFSGSPGMVSRQMWTGADVDPEGTVSPDGRYLSFADWSTGDLAIRDLSTGTTRRLTAKGDWSTSNDFAEESTISRDGTQVAYSWYDDKKGRYELRLLRTDASPGTAPRTLFDNPDISWLGPYDWTPDGKRIILQVARKDRNQQIGFVTVGDGSFTPLRSIEAPGANRLFLSPDGNVLAYDLHENGTAEGSDIFLIPLAGGEPTAVAQHSGLDVICGWSPDGKTLLFASDRSGSMGLWGQRMTSGKPEGSPTLIKSDIGPFVTSVGLTAAGSLLYGVRTGAPTVAIGSLDLEQGRLASPGRPLETYLTVTRGGEWSPDGAQLATVSVDNLRRHTSLVIRSADGSHPRTVPAAMRILQRPRWAPDGSMMIQGTDLNGRQGIYRLNLESGEVTPLVPSATGASMVQGSWLNGGKAIVYRRGEGEKIQVRLRDLTTNEDRVLREQSGGSLFGVTPSPDGRTIAFIENDTATRVWTLNIMPVAGGPSKELFRVAAPAFLLNLAEWGPDGRSIMFVQRGGTAKPAVWTIPASGGTPKIVEGLSPSTNIRIHPDGRQVAYETGEGAMEIWTLENFLPPQTTARKEARK